MNNAILKLWEKFNDSDLTTMQLLCGCAKIYGPSEDNDEDENSDENDE